MREYKSIQCDNDKDFLDLLYKHMDEGWVHLELSQFRLENGDLAGRAMLSRIIENEDS